MKKILLIIAMLWGVAHAQTIGYLRYDTVKVMKNGGRGSLDVTGNVRFTGLLAKSAGTDSVVVRDVNGNLGTTAKSAFGSSGWSLTGNAGTTAGTNFIGTTDAQDLVAKANSTEQLRLLSTGGIRIPTRVDSTVGVVFIGSDRFIHSYQNPSTATTLGQSWYIGRKSGNFNFTGASGGFGGRNLAIGDSTLYANTTGYRNVAIGVWNSTSNTTGFENTSVGANAHERNIDGYDNTAIGAISLQFNTSGWRNTALGFSTLQFNTTGARNTAIGGRAMQNSSTGFANVAVGFDALAYTTAGDHNVGVGLDALYFSDGTHNTAIGDSTLWGIYNSQKHMGYKNTAIGSRAGYHLGDTYPNFASIFDTAITLLGANASRDSSIPYTTSLQNMTVIGYDARGFASNQVVLGNDNVTSTLLKGALNARGYGTGANTGTATYALQVDASGNIIEGALGGGGGSGTVNSGTQYRLGYYAATGTAISEAAAITANRALISDANGVPTHSTTTATQLGYLNAATGTTGTTSTNLVFSASPTFTGTITGAAATLSGLLKVADGTAAAPTITANSNTNTGISFYNGSGSAGDQMKVSASTLGAVMSVQNTNGSGYSGIEYLNNSGTTQVFTGLYIPTNEFRFNNIGTSGTIAFKIASNNALVVNNNLSLTAAFYGAGTATFDASGNISSVSDTRLKTNIKPYNSGIKEIMQLRPIQYSWNDKSGMETKGTYAGFSAQNVKDAIPLGTGVNAEGYLSLQERAILATTVTALQEAIRRIEALEKEIKKLKLK